MSEKHTIIPASYAVLIKDNKILLLRRFNTGYEDGNYSLVSGHVEEGESFITAVIREAKEEANIDVKEEDCQMIHAMHRKKEQGEKFDRVDTFFLIKNWEGEIKNLEPDKCDDLSWFDMDNIPENTIPFIRKVIQNIKDKKFYDEYGWESE